MQFWHLPGRWDSRQQEFQVWSGSTWSAQLTALVERQGKCQVIPVQCTPANDSCSASKSTTLSGFGIAGQGLHHHKHNLAYFSLTASPYICLQWSSSATFFTHWVLWATLPGVPHHQHSISLTKKTPSIICRFGDVPAYSPVSQLRIDHLSLPSLFFAVLLVFLEMQWGLY